MSYTMIALLIGYVGGMVAGIIVFRPVSMWRLGYKNSKEDKDFNYQRGYQEGREKGTIEGMNIQMELDDEIARMNGFDLHIHEPEAHRAEDK